MYWITTIGGGTGTHTVLRGLKKQATWQDITAIVAVTDSGGSTGRLRDEFGTLPVGDFRMALAALADEDRDGNILRELFLYRFDKGEGLTGHNFGNLFLTAITDIMGSEEKALEYVSRILRIAGRVLPVSNEKINLAAEYEDGEIIKSETFIDEPEHIGGKRIKKLWTEPEVQASDRALRAIKKSDIIVIASGDVYTSILSCITVPGVAEAIQKSEAKVVYVMNLMTKYSQTHEFTAQDHVNEIVRYTGREPDYILINNTPLPEDILEEYKKANEFPVVDDLPDEDHIIRTDLLADEKFVKPSGDVLKRSLIRHGSDKLAKAIANLV